MKIDKNWDKASKRFWKHLLKREKEVKSWPDYKQNSPMKSLKDKS